MRQPPAPVTCLTLEMFQLACVELRRRIQVAEAGGNLDDQRDIVIARGVTPDQINKVPHAWRENLQLTLTLDGALLLVKIVNFALTTPTMRVFIAAAAPARARGLWPLLGREAGRVRFPHPIGFMQPDVVLESSFRTPFAFFDIELAYRSCPQIIRTAAEYFTHFPTVEVVAFFKFFAPLQPDRDNRNQLRVPALAIVFGRGDSIGPNGVRRIRVEKMRSFGNAHVPATALAWFERPDVEGPLEPFPQASHHADPSRYLPDHLSEGNLLEEVLCLGRDVIDEFPVEQQSLQVNVDVVELFLEAMRGWRDFCLAPRKTTHAFSSS